MDQSQFEMERIESTQFTFSEQHRIASWWCHRCFSIMSPTRESDLSKSDPK